MSEAYAMVRKRGERGRRVVFFQFARFKLEQIGSKIRKTNFHLGIQRVIHRGRDSQRGSTHLGGRNGSESSLKLPYERPMLKKLTPEQSKLRLFGHCTAGDAGARDLLDLLFPEQGRKQEESPHSDREAS